jgi:EAL domain-containing protein (putative c-di-GMP-specific phosphodiesterase class I)
MWCLDAYVDGSANARRIPVDENGRPLTLGRSRKAEFHLPYEYVSGLHARIVCGEDGQLWLEDLSSSNGTFVNAQQAHEPMALVIGDIVHIGASEFIIAWEDSDTVCDTQILEQIAPPKPSDVARQASWFRELMSQKQVRSVFEPIVELRERPLVIGFEALGRGTHSDLSDSPGLLFQLAEQCDSAQALSRLFRQFGLRESAGLPGRKKLFINTHPEELQGDALVTELTQLRKSGFDAPLVVEVHEGAVLNTTGIRELRAQLNALDIGIAYDDFGAGQARLVELVEVPPDYLKFDKSLILGLPTAPAGQVQMVRQLVNMVRDLDIACLAEGVETRQQFEICMELGFTHGQGYYLGRGHCATYWTEKLSKPSAIA